MDTKWEFSSCQNAICIIEVTLQHSSLLDTFVPCVCVGPSLGLVMASNSPLLIQFG